jgi:hypothetical protein
LFSKVHEGPATGHSFRIQKLVCLFVGIRGGSCNPSYWEGGIFKDGLGSGDFLEQKKTFPSTQRESNRAKINGFSETALKGLLNTDDS